MPTRDEASDLHKLKTLWLEPPGQLKPAQAKLRWQAQCGLIFDQPWYSAPPSACRGRTSFTYSHAVSGFRK